MRRFSGRTGAVRSPALFALAIAAMAVPAPVGAQATLDPRTLQVLQQSLGVGGTGTSTAAGLGNAGQQLDSARARGAAAADDRANRLDADTAEEVALRREFARTQLTGIEQVSPIEREYRQRLGDNSLRQFGYDLFRSAPSGAPLTGSIAGDYVLGVGDELVVSFQGATPGSQTARIDREGRLIVGQLPPIRAAGRTLSAVRGDLAAQTRRTLLGTEVNATVGQVRAISVFVGGEVGSPGAYQLTSLADIAAAISQAGGIRRTGSLRRVRIVRASGTLEVDLYGLLGIGTPQSVRLREGDRVIVPVLGPTVAISGGVTRPGIYELRGPASVGALLAYAGGTVRPRGDRVSISRIERDGSEVFLRGTSPKTTLIAGDAVQVIGGSAGGAIGRVLLRGSVLNPGPRPLAAAPTLRDLVGEVQDLRSETYLPLAIVIRADPATGARRFVPVDLGAALSGRAPFALRSEDRVYILSQTDAAFVNRASVRSIVLGQPNPQPGCRALDRLATLVRDTQSARYNVVTRGAFIAANGSAAPVQSTLAQRSTTSADQRVVRARGNATDDEILGAAQGYQRQAAADADNLTPGFISAGGAGGSDTGVATRATDGVDALQCPPVFQEEPELLPIMIENSIGVGGAVRRPGAYPVAGPTDAATLATLAQGLLSRSEGVVLDVTRARGDVNTTERLSSLADGRLPGVLLRAGDDVRFNAATAQFEPGGVLLTGEVRRPGLFTIKRGERLSELLARAGGATDLAYPYGTIFTRRAVREQQQEGLRRTSRELNEALLVAATRSSSTASANNGGGIGGAAQFISAIANVDPIGRVVVEADPRVLARRPDLDIVLEAGDSIFVPKTPGFVLVLGDIGNPGALQFIPGKTSGEYLGETGGARRSADLSRAFVVLPNGAAQPLKVSFGRKSGFTPPPGSTIIVPVNTTKFLGLGVARDIATIVGQFVSSIATAALLARGR